MRKEDIFLVFNCLLILELRKLEVLVIFELRKLEIYGILELRKSDMCVDFKCEKN